MKSTAGRRCGVLGAGSNRLHTAFFLGHGRGTTRPDGRGLSQAVRLSRGPDNRSAIRACHGIAIATVQAGNPITYLCLLPVCEIGYRLGFINTRVWFTDTRVGFTDTRSPSVIRAFVAVSAARRRHNKHGNRQCKQQRSRKRTQHGTSFFAFANHSRRAQPAEELNPASGRPTRAQEEEARFPQPATDPQEAALHPDVDQGLLA